MSKRKCNTYQLNNPLRLRHRYSHIPLQNRNENFTNDLSRNNTIINILPPQSYITHKKSDEGSYDSTDSGYDNTTEDDENYDNTDDEYIGDYEHRENTYDDTEEQANIEQNENDKQIVDEALDPSILLHEFSDFLPYFNNATEALLFLKYRTGSFIYYQSSIQKLGFLRSIQRDEENKIILKIQQLVFYEELPGIFKGISRQQRANSVLRKATVKLPYLNQSLTPGELN
ncbi:14609_t:CDS:2, partial [Rhizophagus irregularis]